MGQGLGLEQPVPVSATYDSFADRLTVNFNRPLVPGPVLGGTVTFRASNVLRRAVDVSTAGSTLTANSVFLVAAPDGDVVNYAPPPFDIVDLQSGGLAQPFADFPLLLI